MVPVIHFGTLSELLAEFEGEGRQIVRVYHKQQTETRTTKDGIPFSHVIYEVHVRAWHRNFTLSYTPMMTRVELGPFVDEVKARARCKQVTEEARRVRMGVCVAIRAAGHEARPGLIDLGGVQPVVGEPWPLSE